MLLPPADGRMAQPPPKTGRMHPPGHSGHHFVRPGRMPSARIRHRHRRQSFSQWPEPIGLAATGDAALVQQFGDIARQEYLAVGIRVALHPMADLATEPRWARINGTFGEDAELASRMVSAYIRGFQGEKLGPHSVACMTKHFPGGGPQKDGEDPHFSYGKDQVYPGNNFDYHLIPFEAAFQAGTAQIMPYYGMPVGTPSKRWVLVSTRASSPACCAGNTASTGSSVLTGCSSGFSLLTDKSSWKPSAGAWKILLPTSG